MEIDTKIHKVKSDDKELQNIIDELDKDFTLLSDMLNVDDYYDYLVDVDDYINDLEDYPVSFEPFR